MIPQARVKNKNKNKPKKRGLSVPVTIGGFVSNDIRGACYFLSLFRLFLSKVMMNLK